MPGRATQGRCPMLEPYALKGARTVLRGGGGGDLTSLPDPQASQTPSVPGSDFLLGNTWEQDQKQDAHLPAYRPLENKTERQTVSSARGNKDPERCSPNDRLHENKAER